MLADKASKADVSALRDVLELKADRDEVDARGKADRAALEEQLGTLKTMASKEDLEPMTQQLGDLFAELSEIKTKLTALDADVRLGGGALGGVLGSPGLRGGGGGDGGDGGGFNESAKHEIAAMMKVVNGIAKELQVGSRPFCGVYVMVGCVFVAMVHAVYEC